MLDVWDNGAATRVINEAIIPSISWQLKRGRDVKGAPFKPYTPEYAYRTGKPGLDRPDLSVTGNLLAVWDEKGGSSTGGMMRFINEKSSGIRFNYTAPGNFGYVYAVSVRQILGWNSKTKSLFKRILTETLDRMLPADGSTAPGLVAPLPVGTAPMTLAPAKSTRRVSKKKAEQAVADHSELASLARAASRARQRAGRARRKGVG